MSAAALKTVNKTDKANNKASISARVKVKRHNLNTALSDTQTPEPCIPLEKLLQAAELKKEAIPFLRELTLKFDEPLTDIQSVSGPMVDAALNAKDASAATDGNVIFLHGDTTLDVVAHEVAHVLQGRNSSPVAQHADNKTAIESEAVLAEQSVKNGLAVPSITESIAQGSIWLRETRPESGVEVRTRQNDQAESDFLSGLYETTPQQAIEPRTDSSDVSITDSRIESIDGAQQSVESDDITVDSSAVAVEDNAEPTYELPPMPEIDVEPADVSAELAAIEQAEDADAKLSAFSTAPPSVKAREHDSLEADIQMVSTEEQQSFSDELPTFDAHIVGTDDLPAPAEVLSPEVVETSLEPDEPVPAPEAEVDPTPDAGHADLNRNIENFITRTFVAGDARSLGRSFQRVGTGDNDVETSAGERPTVVTEGETDPQRITDQRQNASEEVNIQRDNAAAAVITGPGPEQVVMREVREEFHAEPRVLPEAIAATEQVEGAAEFREKQLDPEVIAIFDADHSDAMTQSLTESNAQMDSAVSARNTERDAAVSAAEEQRDLLNSNATDEQRTEVSTQRNEIQSARQHAVDEQARHVQELETSTGDARRTAEGDVQEEINTTNRQVTTDFRQAEVDAEAEVANGELRAENERTRQEEESKKAVGGTGLPIGWLINLKNSLSL